MMKKFLQFIQICQRKKNRAFTLVETLVAISIFTMSILSLMSILASGIFDTNYAKNKIIAAYLAQEGIEYIRNMRDTYVLYTLATTNDWGKFKAKFSLNSCNFGSECGIDNSVTPVGIKKCVQLNDCRLFFNNGSYNSSAGTDSGFTRKIWMDTAGLGNGEVKISSVVSWTQGSGDYKITFSENLFNWTE